MRVLQGLRRTITLQLVCNDRSRDIAESPNYVRKELLHAFIPLALDQDHVAAKLIEQFSERI